MKPYQWLLLVVLVALTTFFIYRTSDTSPREKHGIDLNWRFTLSDPSGAHRVDFDDTGWRVVSLPHDWMIEQPVARDNPSGAANGFYPGGIAWYRKTLSPVNFEEDQRYFLVFDGVYMNSDVWFNGVSLGSHAYGYIGFHYDITSHIRTDTANVIAVRTDCSQLPVDRWYPGAGIYRHVHLVSTHHLHFPLQSNTVKTTVEDETATISVSIGIANEGERSRRFKLKSDLLDPDGNLLSSQITSRFLEAGQRMEVSESHTVEQPLRWSPDHPHRYRVKNYLVSNKRVLDNQSTAFGIRTVQFEPDSGLILNGEKVFMKGVCIHHDGGGFGAAVPEATWERRLVRLKKLGVNALRLAHNPHAPEVLDMCDSLGFLVINEMYDTWELPWEDQNGDFDFEETWREDLTRFIRRDINHPSVILWSLGNETIEQLEAPQRGIRWYRDLIELTRSLDPTREVTCAMHPGNASEGHEIPSSMIFLSPVVSYNYRTDSFASWREQYPRMVWIASETKPYNENHSEPFESISYLDNSWQDMTSAIAGQFIWAGIDYLGESMGWPDRGYRHGLLTTTGRIKPHAWYTASIYSEEPMVKLAVLDRHLADSLNRLDHNQLRWAAPPVARHWTFPHDTLEKQVLVYTNCQEVELTLNENHLQSLGRENFPDGVIRTRIPYVPGTLTVTGRYQAEDGTVTLVRDTLETAGKPASLAMEPDKPGMKADGKDVVHITTRVVDASGVQNPWSNHRVNYRVDGPARLELIDNGDPADHTPYRASSRRVLGGEHMVVIRSMPEPGDLIISATAEGLESARLKIESANRP